MIETKKSNRIKSKVNRKWRAEGKQTVVGVEVCVCACAFVFIKTCDFYCMRVCVCESVVCGSFQRHYPFIVFCCLLLLIIFCVFFVLRFSVLSSILLLFIWLDWFLFVVIVVMACIYWVFDKNTPTDISWISNYWLRFIFLFLSLHPPPPPSIPLSHFSTSALRSLSICLHPFYRYLCFSLPCLLLYVFLCYLFFFVLLGHSESFLCAFLPSNRNKNCTHTFI